MLVNFTSSLMQTNSQDPTNQEILYLIQTSNQKILDVINTFAEHTERRSKKIESTIVTKDYLDEKMSDFQGNLTVALRKEDRKLLALVDILQEHHVLSDGDVKKILALEPFPQG
ncbi:TPA: hypothetical protein DD617_02445 [Candidatus Uhrbacteria bacterium]|nr:hypothetical protein [Candidatus Uhrbacteria bacterium]